MTVPKASMNEHDSAVLREDEVGLAWKRGFMEFVAKPKFVECFADDELRARILATYTSHDCASDFRIDVFH